MPEQQLRVMFEPTGRRVFVLGGTKLLEAAGRAGMTLDTPCGGSGTCGKCRVQVTRGACDPDEAEQAIFSAAELADGWRLACRTSVGQEMIVHVPATSRLAGGHRIITAAEGAEAEVRPAVRKVYVELPEPTLDDGGADLLRLETKIGRLKADLPMLRRLSAALRSCDFKGTAVTADHRLIEFEPGDTSAECYGAAFDTGTTTLVGSLLDLRTGEELAVASGINPQVGFGDDVVSRIRHASQGPEQFEEIRKPLLEAVGRLVTDLCEQTGIARERIYEASFAGNTTMQHLLCGLDVTQLGTLPFVPGCARGLVVSAGELGAAIHPQAVAYVFPVIGGFVGGDTVAGMLATELAEGDAPAMMIDIGTNGEIVLAGAGEVLAASTAAGPAFEGARISCGMRATGGAIEKVVFDGDVRLSVIGNVDPIGICGSALVDLAAGLLDCGIVTPEGRMLAGDELPAGLPEPLRRRVSLDESTQPQFVLADGNGEATAVTLRQRDIRELQLSAGAIRAGVAILLKQAGIASGDLKRVLIAGGFGSFIRRNHAQRLGLLPADVPHERIHYVGNASLNGARWALLSTDARKRAETLARRVRHVELSRDMDFQMQFAEAMIFPVS